MNEKSLIAEVQKHKILYNVYHAKYWWKRDRNKAWVRIGSKLKVPDRECALKWSRLRSVFSAILRRRKALKADNPDHIISPWRHERRMAFLLPYLKGITTEDLAPGALEYNADLEDSDVSSDEEEELQEEVQGEVQEPVQEPEEAEVEEIDEIETKPRIDSISEGSVEILDQISAANQEQMPLNVKEDNIQDNNNLQLPEGDEIDMFYLSIAKTVKKLAPVEQAKLRMTICNIVSEAEIRQSEVNNYYRLSSARLSITPSVNYYNN